MVPFVLHDTPPGNDQRNVLTFVVRDSFGDQLMRSSHLTVVGGEDHNRIVPVCRGLDSIEDLSDLPVHQLDQPPVHEAVTTPVIGRKLLVRKLDRSEILRFFEVLGKRRIFRRIGTVGQSPHLHNGLGLEPVLALRRKRRFHLRIGAGLEADVVRIEERHDKKHRLRRLTLSQKRPYVAGQKFALVLFDVFEEVVVRTCKLRLVFGFRKVDLPAVQRLITRPAKYGTDRLFLSLPDLLGIGIPIGVPPYAHARRGGSREERVARRNRERIGTVGVGEGDALPDQPVQIRRRGQRMSQGTDRVVGLLIGQNQDDVRLRLRHFTPRLLVRNRGTGHTAQRRQCQNG